MSEGLVKKLDFDIITNRAFITRELLLPRASSKEKLTVLIKITQIIS